MKKEYDFSTARRITPAEVDANRKGIEAFTGKKRRKRPGPAPTAEAEKYQPIAIRLHPKVLAWARKEAAKRGVGYQTVINETLLKKAG
jgi:predicted DNA binding CopG/RHH family protein